MAANPVRALPAQTASHPHARPNKKAAISHRTEQYTPVLSMTTTSGAMLIVMLDDGAGR
jgi:hypothetical protein